MIKLSVMLTLFSLPDIQSDRREHFSPISSYTENSMFNENTSLKYKNINIILCILFYFAFYIAYILFYHALNIKSIINSFLFWISDALKTKNITYK